MRQNLFIFFLVYFLFRSGLVNAQYRSANAYFNNFNLGINTKTGMFLAQRPLPNIDSYEIEGSSISDEKTGQLLFYTTGKRVFKPDHSLFVNGVIDEMPYSDPQTLIVPDPADVFGYYIFYTNHDSLLYARVNLKNGGEVFSKGNIVAVGVRAGCLSAVSYVHKKGWWIITHALTGDEYYSFLLLSGGIVKIPVISKTGPVLNSKDLFSFKYSSHKGDKILAHFINKTNNTKQLIIVTIDKRCGRLNQQQIVYTQTTTDSYQCATFSSDDSKIYLLGDYDRVIQFSGSNYEISNICTYLISGNTNRWASLYTGVDHVVYFVQWSYSDAKFYVDRIVNADLTVPQCRAIPWKSLEPIDINANGASWVIQPGQIMDQTISDSLPDKIDFKYDNACKQFTVNFTIEHDAIYDSVLWQFGDGAATTNTSRNTAFNYTVNGDYVVKLIGYICGQPDTVSKVLRVREQPKLDLGNDTAVCYGSIVILKANIKADGYLWSDSSEQEQLTVTKGGKYWLQLTFGDCKRADTINVIQNPKIWTALGDEYFVCEDDKDLIKLDAGEKFNQYKWTPTGDTTQWIIVGDVGDYFVVVKDYRGCIGSDGTQVKRRCPVKVYFPNVFTPNNDGLNDSYTPKGKDVISFTMKVYNRWGQLVFETNDINKTWNGLFKGEAANADVYVYTATYSGYFNKRLKEYTAKGAFTLLR